MTISMRDLTAGAYRPLLGTLSHLLDKAGAHAEAVDADVQALLDARLAPDMLPFSFHVQFACHQATEWLLPLAGRKDAPFRMAQLDLGGLKALVEAARERVTADAGAYDGGETRQVSFPLQGDLVLQLDGLRYARDWVTHQVSFHVAIAYAVLRNQGVELGIRDWVTSVGDAIRSGAPA